MSPRTCCGVTLDKIQKIIHNSDLNNCKDFTKVSLGESGRFACLAGQIRKKAAQSLSSRVALTTLNYELQITNYEQMKK